MKHHNVAPYWGIRARADPGSDIPLRAASFARRMPARAFYTGRTAAALYGLPLPVRFSAETLLHVGVPAGDRRVAALGIVAHHLRIADDDVITHRSLRVTSLARTWCDLATAGLSLAELVAAGDRTLSWRDPLLSPDQLRSAIYRYEGRRGARLMRTALALLSDRSDSAPESEVRVAIHEAGFPPPEVNVEVRLPSGETLQPDMSWPEHKVAIDYEGEHHRVNRDQWNRDIRRFRLFEDAGWRNFRATADDYRSPHKLLIWLARHLPT